MIYIIHLKSTIYAVHRKRIKTEIMKELELYLESLTFAELCNQQGYNLEISRSAGITKKQIIESALKVQRVYNSRYTRIR